MSSVHHNPLSFKISKWYAYFFAATFILYGGVKLVLGFLDRTYEEIPMLAVFLGLGVMIACISVGFRDHKKWGLYGLLLLHGLVVILAVVQLRQDPYKIILLILSLFSLLLLLLPSTKKQFSPGQH